ncbi:hypothetical protein ACT7C2_13715 [Bacillus pacificus]
MIRLTTECMGGDYVQTAGRQMDYYLNGMECAGMNHYCHMASGVKNARY